MENQLSHSRNDVFDLHHFLSNRVWILQTDLLRLFFAHCYMMSASTPEGRFEVFFILSVLSRWADLDMDK
jgi:hypothetical protein